LQRTTTKTAAALPHAAVIASIAKNAVAVVIVPQAVVGDEALDRDRVPDQVPVQIANHLLIEVVSAAVARATVNNVVNALLPAPRVAMRRRVRKAAVRAASTTPRHGRLRALCHAARTPRHKMAK
jgi:hypothetical protein